MSLRRQRGVAAIELALLAPFLLLLGGGIAELGHALYTYDTLAKSARSAARYIAMRESADPALDAAARNAARNVALCGVPACGAGTPVVPGLTVAHILVETPISNTSLANISTGAVTGSLDMVSVTISPAGSPFAFQPWVAIPQVSPLWAPINLNFNFGPIHVAMPRVS